MDALTSWLLEGEAALERGDHREASVRLVAASQIVNQLLATLDRRQAPELCQSLSQIYTFVCARLITASVQRSAQAAAEAERVFAPVAAGFLRVLGAASASAR